ncbi:hypothetical protein ACP2AV_06345 [Aliiroseovarius sp. PTFE2010]|uniref:hypothetical protein n=1 Tax=Aliiroseovarius sp. PTFE2010 TaxID=3417190 RepID=UPI003CEB9A3C
MTSRIIFVLCLAGMLAACGRVSESRINPLNWFGNARNETAAAGLLPADYNAEDPRPYIAQVTDLRIERTASGAIVHATGITPLLGYWDAELVSVPSDDPSVLTYQFRMAPPSDNAMNGTPQQRTVHVGAALSNRALDDIRTVRVQAAANALSVRR